MSSIELAYVLPEDAAAGVQSLVVLPSKIRLTFCPARYVPTLLSKTLHGYVPASYALLTRDPDGSIKVREGETADLYTRLHDHRSGRRHVHFDAVLWFSGPSIDKETARGLQFLMGDVLAANGCGQTVPSNAEWPRDVTWEVVRHIFEEIRALTRRLGFQFFEPPVSSPPGVHLHLEIEDRPHAEEMWDFAGGYRSTVALIRGQLALLAHSQIRARCVPSARKNHLALREDLKARRLLVPGQPGILLTLTDLPFPSLDAAAKFLRGDLGGCRRLWVPRPPRAPGL